MMIENVKKVVMQNKGIPCFFRFHGARNQIDEFRGVIINLYPSIFTILSDATAIYSFS